MKEKNHERKSSRNCLYRFIGLDNFMDILINNSLVFVRPSIWDDPKELESLNRTINENILIESKKYNKPISDFRPFNKLLKLKWMSENIYGQCWTSLEESDALWRIYYNEGKTLRISTSLDTLRQIKEVVIQEVEYTDVKRTFEIPCNECEFYELASNKRTAFSHESEVRLFYIPEMNSSDLQIEKIKLYKSHFIALYNGVIPSEEEMSLCFPEFLHEWGIENKTIDDLIFENKEVNHVRKISINPPQSIASVMVSPFAPQWYCKTVEKICEKFDLKYLGKSTLYSLN